jgi:hypothetical protein
MERLAPFLILVSVALVVVDLRVAVQHRRRGIRYFHRWLMLACVCLTLALAIAPLKPVPPLPPCKDAYDPILNYDECYPTKPR